MIDRKSHWEEVYNNKDVDEVSWYQPKSETSMEYIRNFDLKKNAKIIDIGGGDSFLAENLLAEGFSDITVLDISERAIDRAKSRLGKTSKKIQWIVADASNFSPNEKYDLWHDRATFHFLTNENRINGYLHTMKSSLKKGGFGVLGTFSEKGPEKCSGIKVKQYSLHELSELLKTNFKTLECKNTDHITPTGAIQNFSFCSFKIKQSN